MKAGGDFRDWVVELYQQRPLKPTPSCSGPKSAYLNMKTEFHFPYAVCCEKIDLERKVYFEIFW